MIGARFSGRSLPLRIDPSRILYRNRISGMIRTRCPRPRARIQNSQSSYPRVNASSYPAISSHIDRLNIAQQQILFSTRISRSVHSAGV